VGRRRGKLQDELTDISFRGGLKKTGFEREEKKKPLLLAQLSSCMSVCQKLPNRSANDTEGFSAVVTFEAAVRIWRFFFPDPILGLKNRSSFLDRYVVED
jgi:hypothetical protein